MRLGVQAALVGDSLLPGDVEILDGRIAALGLPSRNGLRGIAAPGFVDLQVNGFAGVDFLHADADGYARAGEALLETGVTAYTPTFISASEELLLAALAEIPRETSGPRVLGAHLEGPFISPARLGVHPSAARRDPDLELAGRLLEATDVRLVTVAPELPGALALIEQLRRRGVVVSCGHTDATAEEAHAAFDSGARAVTHLFNTMRRFGHRDPGVVGAALARPDVIVQLVVDGVHLAAEAVQLAWRAAAGRLSLVTDAIAAARCGDGSFALGEVEVEVRDGVARRTADGALAGSTLTMIQAVLNLHELGIPLEAALHAASAVPAHMLGLRDAGRLEPGAPADVVVLGDGLEVERVLVAGEARVAS